MGSRTIPDGAGVTNHFSVSFAPWVTEVGVTSLSGLEDETEIIDGPDSRGYSTGKTTRKDLTVVIPSHDPGSKQLHAWKNAVENGLPGHAVTGVVTVMDAGGNVIAIYELERCMCRTFAPNDFAIDGGEVAQETFTISYYRLRRIGP